ncbi:methyltransferase-like protein [Thalictrum thalictroides]|uniref:Methyltransferase-like protein n=1 Tax=Thalictrum thalictroides TaxID=46969 RepID=A0A7J6XEP3_THATH|nr:methyltransferase-like protein [Thalictrum thalictroides]
MTIERATFENINPSQFISFTFPNPLSTDPQLNPYGDSLRIAVLDSPNPISDPVQLAAMLVPKDREDDWIFSTESGLLQLLFNLPGISRLVLVGNSPHDADYFPIVYNRSTIDDTIHHTKFEESITPLLLALSPKSTFTTGLPEIPFVIFEDNVIRSVSVKKCFGPCVGEMLVEDVEIEGLDGVREFRRRLRFKRMPNLVQTEIRIFHNNGFGDTEFRLDTGCLVHPYLPPMVASLSLIAKYLEECVCSGVRPRVLCIGVGGGALLSFLQAHFGFEVFGVECDEMVVKVAKQYFGLVEGDLLRVCIGDGIEVVEKFATKHNRGNMASGGIGDDVENDQNVDVFGGLDIPFDIIMVDLDARDARNGLGAPPFEFIRKQVLLATKLALHKHGILAVNVIPVSKTFYDYLICELREVFAELYEINVGNEENYVLIATVSPANYVLNDNKNSILEKLKLTIPKQFLDCIRKL